MPLEPFSLEETRLYLTSHAITDEKLITQIHKDTGGLPVLVELLAATKPQAGFPLPDISPDAVKRFLQWTPQEERRRIALLAAVPRQFNRDILSAALGVDATNDFNWLESQSYIRTSTERGRFYHEKVRELMLRYLWNTSPSDVISVHQRLFIFFDDQQKSLGFINEDGYKNAQWRKLEQERVYHAVSAQPDKQLSDAINTFIHAYRWRKRFAANIAHICRQVAQETSRQLVRTSADQFLELLHADEQNNYTSMITYFTLYDSRDDITLQAHRDIFALRGRTYMRVRKFDQALNDFNQALSLTPRDQQLLKWRGLIYMQLERYDEALANFNQALTLDPEDLDFLVGRGLIFRILRRYNEALADFNQALILDPQNSQFLAWRGNTYQELERYDEALADFNQALTLDPQNPQFLAWRGLAHQELERYNEALADFNQTITLDPQNPQFLAWRGLAHQELERYDEALADFNQLITLNEHHVPVLTLRSKTFQLIGHYDAALADFNQIIALNEHNISILIDRGTILIWLERYDEALRNFNQVLALDEGNDTALAWRGEIYRRQGNYDRALHDLNLAIQIDPSDSFGITRRAAVYLADGDHDAAYNDIDRVKDARTSYVASIYNYAVVLMLSNEYDEALKALSQAIELDPIARSYARHDDLFNPIRNEPAFQQLMQAR